MTWVSHKRKCDNLKDPSHLLDFKVPLSIDIFFGQLNRLGTVERHKLKIWNKTDLEWVLLDSGSIWFHMQEAIKSEASVHN